MMNPRVRRHAQWLGWAVSAAVVAAGLVALPASHPMGSASVPANDATEPESGGTDGESSALNHAEVSAALDEAAASGEPVEVLSARTEWDTVFAEPSGRLRLDTSIAAVRTRVGAPEGEWRDIDVSLTHTTDGVAPVAPAVPMTFSSGGKDPLVTIGRDGQELELSWPGVLPAPVIDGAQATYTDVLPGVDLVMSVDPDGTGFSEVLVVKSRQAAKNPALTKLTLGWNTSPGVELAPRESGGFDVLDEAGQRVFTSPPAVMWDSAGGDRELHAAGSGAADVAEQRLRHPVQGDRVADVVTDVADRVINLVPDEEMLSDPDTAFPVFIDPRVDRDRGVARILRSAWGGDDTVGFPSGTAGMGRCQVARDSDCRRDHTKRLAFGFGGLGPVRGATVSKAEFRIYGTQSWNCDRRMTRVYRINPITARQNSTWNNMSGWGDHRLVRQRMVAHRAGCPTQNPPRQPRWIEFNVTSAAQWAASHSNNVYFGMRAANEQDMRFGWKRYRADAKLKVWYNHPPNKPYALETSPGMPGCKSFHERYVTHDNTPLLRAKITDPDGQNVKGRFYWAKHQSGSSWSAATVRYSAWTASGNKVSVGMPGGDRHLADGIYRWRVRGWDGAAHGRWSTGPESLNCHFEVDTNPPDLHDEDVSIGVPYVFDQWHDPVVGLPEASITIDAADQDVNRLRYQVGGGPRETVPMTTASKAITFDPSYGVTELRFWLLDKAGNVSPEVEKRLLVMSPRVQHAWAFNDDNAGEGSTAADVARPQSRAMDLRVGTGVAWGSGYTADYAEYTRDVDGDQSLRFSDAASAAPESPDSSAFTQEPAVFVRDSFTVTARVKLDAFGEGRSFADSFTAVSQDGPGNSAFAFGVRGNTGAWAIWAHENGETDADWSEWKILDTGLRPTDQFLADGSLCGEPGFPECDGVPDWQHVSLVHDAAAQTLRLYVEGELPCEVDSDLPCEFSTSELFDWDSVGPLRVGRFQSNGSLYGSAGKVDEVLVFDAALNEPQIDRLKNNNFDDVTGVDDIFDDIFNQMLSSGLAGWWPVDEQPDSGISYIEDATRNDHQAGLHGTWSWLSTGDGPDGGSGVSLDGESAYAATDHPVLTEDENDPDPDLSFSVSAWVRPDELGNMQRTVAAQAGTERSLFQLTYRPSEGADGHGAWCFTLPLADESSAEVRQACAPWQPEVAQWTHLAGVYDDDAHEARLFVDGVLVASVPVDRSWQAGGSFSIGRSTDATTGDDFFSGAIGQVRVYQRTLSPAEVAYLA